MRTFEEWKKELCKEFPPSPNFGDVANVGMYTFHSDCVLCGPNIAENRAASCSEIELELAWLENMADALKSYLAWRKENEEEGEK